MRPFAVASALLAAVALAAVVALQVPRDDARARRAGALTLLGDSLNVGIEPYLDGELEGWTISRHDVAGRSGADGLAALRALGDAVAPVVVISLGTNDPQADVAGFRRLVEAVVRQSGPGRCVVWSTIWLGGPNGPFNDVLRAAAGRHPNLEVADWAGMVAASPELLAPDGVHGSPEGYARRAEQVARLAERCLPAHDPGDDALRDPRRSPAILARMRRTRVLPRWASSRAGRGSGATGRSSPRPAARRSPPAASRRALGAAVERNGAPTGRARAADPTRRRGVGLPGALRCDDWPAPAPIAP